MTDTEQISRDRDDIAKLIATQFRSLCWNEDTPPDTQALTGTYLQGAQLFASARPARGQTAEEFGRRMRALRESGRISVFEEKGVGLHIWVTGNVAVAMAGCEMHENQEDVTEDISAFLLVKNPDGWAIAAQAWDVLPSIADALAANGLDADRFDTKDGECAC
ncbi:hypothetical protein [uncultured Roseobacter sp.]|uniref:hypothetical protein n=1 Tax=uncultured Roseobacter sp. TaxID=114847 RepID=UPI00260FCADB|nr:hypothetical protein [uncultured Roseobacter sp.]